MHTIAGSGRILLSVENELSREKTFGAERETKNGRSVEFIEAMFQSLYKEY